MLILFLENIEYLERGRITNADCYCTTFTRLRRAIRRKRPDTLSKCIKVSSCTTMLGPILLKQRRNYYTSSSGKSGVTHIMSIFHTQWLHPIFEVKRALIQHTRFSSGSTGENIHRHPAQREVTWFLPSRVNKLILRFNKCLNRLISLCRKVIDMYVI